MSLSIDLRTNLSSSTIDIRVVSATVPPPRSGYERSKEFASMGARADRPLVSTANKQRTHLLASHFLSRRQRNHGGEACLLDLGRIGLGPWGSDSQFLGHADQMGQGFGLHFLLDLTA